MLLYFITDFYLADLQAFMRLPEGSTASRILGIAAGGALLLGFVHAWIVATIVDWFLSLKTGFFQRVWRLFSGNLQFGLLAAVIVLSSNVAVASLRGSFPAIGSLVPTKIVFLLVAFVAAARLWYPLPAVCTRSEREHLLLVVAWKLSSGHFIVNTLVLAGAAVSTLIIQLSVQRALQFAGLVPFMAEGMNFRATVEYYRANLRVGTLLISFAYLTFVILSTLGVLKQRLSDAKLTT